MILPSVQFQAQVTCSINYHDCCLCDSIFLTGQQQMTSAKVDTLQQHITLTTEEHSVESAGAVVLGGVMPKLGTDR